MGEPGLRVGVVGAGPAGLAALRALRGAGLDAVAFERGRRIGGVWTLEDRPTAAYRSLHLITSRARTEFAELPMPRASPTTRAATRSGATSRTTRPASRCTSTSAWARGSSKHGGSTAEVGSFRRALRDPSASTPLVVASGHNEAPLWPDPAYPGDFAGEQLHALDYVDAEAFRDKRVLVVGMGNSAMDIATDLSHVAQRTLLSVRRGSWVIPKRLFGRPADQLIRPWVAVNVPWRLRQPLAQLMVRLAVGRPESYGLPVPERGLFQAHPTITDTVLRA